MRPRTFFGQVVFGEDRRYALREENGLFCIYDAERPNEKGHSTKIRECSTKEAALEGLD